MAKGSMSDGKLPSFEEVWEKVLAGERISEQDALALWHHPDLAAVGELAHRVRLRLNDPKVVTYVIDRNINYTNACVARCKFCAFWKQPGSRQVYVHQYEPVIREKIAEASAQGATQILMQGGFHPDLPFSYYTELLRSIKRDFPHIIMHSFGPPEVRFFAKTYGMSERQVLEELKDAGLDGLPGSYEILVDRVQQAIAPGKCTPDEWCEIMTIAAELGLNTTATMMFGHIETVEERIEHLRRIRELQDLTLGELGRGFTAFIAWPYQHEKNALTPLVRRGLIRLITAQEYLRMVAVARIYLDNVRHIQSSWVTMGPRVGSASLFFGCDDMGGTMMEENVVSAAGTLFKMSAAEIERIIREAGFEPRVRNTFYEYVSRPPFPEEQIELHAVGS